ncbi:MAG: hypothetical protein KAI66_27335 [Lentisphaeria bacterium]|nr:hypothetical protein [Lentisphaeria bacterium]
MGIFGIGLVIIVPMLAILLVAAIVVALKAGKAKQTGCLTAFICGLGLFLFACVLFVGLLGFRVGVPAGATPGTLVALFPLGLLFVCLLSFGIVVLFIVRASSRKPLVADKNATAEAQSPAPQPAMLSKERQRIETMREGGKITEEEADELVSALGSSTANSAEDGRMKCPYCAERVPLDSRICPVCQSDLVDTPVPLSSPPSRSARPAQFARFLALYMLLASALCLTTSSWTCLQVGHNLLTNQPRTMQFQPPSLAPPGVFLPVPQATIRFHTQIQRSGRFALVLLFGRMALCGLGLAGSLLVLRGIPLGLGLGMLWSAAQIVSISHGGVFLNRILFHLGIHAGNPRGLSLGLNGVGILLLCLFIIAWTQHSQTPVTQGDFT